MSEYQGIWKIITEMWVCKEKSWDNGITYKPTSYPKEIMFIA